MRVFLGKMIMLGYPMGDVFGHFFRYSFNRYFHPLHFLHFLRLIVMAGMFGDARAKAGLGISQA
jgi:hypothetical protein